MRRSLYSLILMVVSLLFFVTNAQAVEGPYMGLDLGATEPTNENYRAHVQTGATGAPYLGFMFNDYVGLQGHFHFVLQEPDNDDRHLTSSPNYQSNIQHENRITTMAGGTIGPRFQIPLGPFFDVYIGAEGGGFKGLGGRLNQWAPGFLAGGGFDINVTPNLAVGLFGRWNRVYMAPHPTFLIGQDPSDQGPRDAQWATAGVSLKYAFAQPAAPPPPPPPPPPPVAKAPPPPAPPTTKKIVLRSVHFDFDKSNIRPDARPVLDEAANMLTHDSTTELVIVEGHTDGVGTEAYNMKLSHRRADAVRNYLVAHGVSASRIRTEGYGKSQPVASNETADGRAQNRRVELHLQ